MKTESINLNYHNQSFGELNIRPKAFKILTREKGAAARIEQLKQELKDVKIFDLNIESLADDGIWAKFGTERSCSVLPEEICGDVIKVSSHLTGGGFKDSVIDYLKFSSVERAREVYSNLYKKAYGFDVENGYRQSPMQQLEWHVEAMKAFEEADFVDGFPPLPEKKSFMERLKNFFRKCL